MLIHPKTTPSRPVAEVVLMTITTSSQTKKITNTMIEKALQKIIAK